MMVDSTFAFLCDGRAAAAAELDILRLLMVVAEGEETQEWRAFMLRNNKAGAPRRITTAAFILLLSPVKSSSLWVVNTVDSGQQEGTSVPADRDGRGSKKDRASFSFDDA